MSTPRDGEQPTSLPPNIVLMQMMMGYYLSRSLYAQAGFTLTRIVRTMANVCVIEGVVAADERTA
jgi:hypothetical protein